MKLQWKNEWNVPVGVGVVSFGVGVGIGYAIRAYLDRRLVRSFDEIMEEVESNEEQLRLNLNGHDPAVIELTEEEEDEWASEEEEEDEWAPTDLLIPRRDHPANTNFREAMEMIEENKHHLIHPEPESIFPDIEEEWDYQVEALNRNPENPYIIHVDEYNDEIGDDGIAYSKSTLTYYKGDDVLVDDHDVPVYNHEKVASPLTFGKGSQDPSIVYIRNERLEADYEVILDHGYYQVEVLGDEIEQSFENQKAPLPKFKLE